MSFILIPCPSTGPFPGFLFFFVQHATKPGNGPGLRPEDDTRIYVYNTSNMYVQCIYIYMTLYICMCPPPVVQC